MLADAPPLPSGTLAELVGRNIKLGRKLAGMNQEQLAVLVEKRRHHVSDWETGKHQPREKSLRLIAKALDQPIPFFYTDHAGDE